MVSLWIRNNLTDRSLQPLRAQLADLIPEGAKLLDIGCANGRFLLEMAGKIERGMGIDLDRQMIDYACQQAERQGGRNLHFVAESAVTALKNLPFIPTHALASLFLHALPTEQAASMLTMLAGTTRRMIIADLIEPTSVFQKAFLHLDEWMAGHYNCYLAYRKAGGMPTLLESAGLEIFNEAPSPVTGVHVWECGRTDGS